MKRISLFVRDSRDVREKRDWWDVPSSRVAPVAHVSLTSPLTEIDGMKCDPTAYDGSL